MTINLYTWFSERKLDFLPVHFIATNTFVDDDRHIWVLEKCTGRYYIGSRKDTDDWLSLLTESVIYFEDPQEAVLYQLTWS